MKKILITGSNGYVGKKLIELLKFDYHLVLFGRTTIEQDCHEYIQGDITNLDDVIRASKKTDIIIHLAAATTSSSETNNHDYFHINSLGTFNILEAAVRNNVGKIIFASSVCAVGLRATPKLILETDRCKPSDGMYGYSKYVAERLCECYAKKYEIKIICLRIAMVVPLHDLVVPKGIQTPYWLFGVHINDVLQALNLSIENDSVKFGIYHIAPDNPWCKFDITRAKKELDFKPIHNFKNLTKNNILKFRFIPFLGEFIFNLKSIVKK